MCVLGLFLLELIYVFRLTLDEIVEELQAGEDPGDIILFPPEFDEN